MSDSMVLAQDRAEAKMEPILDEVERYCDEIINIARHRDNRVGVLKDIIKEYMAFCEANGLEYDCGEILDLLFMGDEK